MSLLKIPHLLVYNNRFQVLLYSLFTKKLRFNIHLQQLRSDTVFTLVLYFYSLGI